MITDWKKKKKVDKLHIFFQKIFLLTPYLFLLSLLSLNSRQLGVRVSLTSLAPLTSEISGKRRMWWHVSQHNLDGSYGGQPVRLVHDSSSRVRILWIASFIRLWRNHFGSSLFILLWFLGSTYTVSLVIRSRNYRAWWCRFHMEGKRLDSGFTQRMKSTRDGWSE